jgi:DNA polymerase-3 subunit gamma/tau
MSVFHLKYRPKKFGDLDLKDVAAKLVKIFEQKDIPQSFLLAGPKGSGKTSAARIIARVVNCDKPINGEPCDKCSNCKEIENGNSIDVIEIDAASNRGIEDIRGLKENSYLLPVALKRKVFIIDEVHMLTKEAFNALLKVIEEPPKHVMFILCTTDEEKIPETVLSRLLKIEFRKGKKQELLESIEKIIKGEKIEIEKEAIDTIVKKSDGSFRNLQKRFNEIVLQYGVKIKTPEVLDYFSKITGDYSLEELETDLKEANTKKILNKLEEMSQKGINFSTLRDNYLEYFQNKLLAINGVVTEVESKLTIDELVEWIKLLINASKQEKEVAIEQLPLQLAVVDFLKDKKSVEISQKVKDVVVESEEIITGVIDIGLIEANWNKLLSSIKPFNHSVEAFLRATRPKKIRGNTLVLEVFYPFHKDKLEETKNREIVSKIMSEVFGHNLCFECILSKDRKKPLVIDNNTPVEKINDQLAVEEASEKKHIYDVAKDIFG